MRLALVHIVPEETNIPFIRARFIAAVFSALLLVGSIGAFATLGLNLGIDFKGGVAIDIETPEEPNLEALREAIAPRVSGDLVVQGISDIQRPNGVLIRAELQEGEGVRPEIAQQQASQAILSAIQEVYPTIDLTDTSPSVVSGKVSDELVRAGTLAVVLALAAMLAYIWFRFEWQFSVGAIVALTHDVIATIGMFAITGFEFNLASIAAILTIVGYSMNDTVVVYDRIREKLRKYKRMELAEVLNLAINKTLSRTLMTSVTTLLALLALFFLGGAVLRSFSFAMIWGVLIGTYSSIFIAAPFLLLTGVNRRLGEEAS